ncbi:MAG: phage major capsid protein [Pyramidobacter sp.]|nr:phage major capsid protein [Pyramidobacter sp.]MBQ8129387.1 phage major capsid protein [Clostridia bacterium]MBR1895499.1 phage major capsid protein [Pyramidobacter sp.]
MNTEELKTALDALGTAVKQYKDENDARLAALEKGKSTAEFDEKLARLEKEIERLEKAKSDIETRLNRPGAAGTSGYSEGDEYRKAFNRWLRKEDPVTVTPPSTVNVGTDGEGGYAVPENLNTAVYNLLREAVPMRSVCSAISIGGNNYSQLVGTHGATGGWVGETDARGATETPKLTKINAVMGEVYANPQATQTALDDICFDVEGWLAQEIAAEFAVMENTAFTSGNGTNKPKGLLAYDTAATKDGTRAFGTLQFIKSGAAATLGDAPGDLFIDLITALKTGHLTGARFMMNRNTLAAVRKLKDGDENYLWQPGLQQGVPSLLLGYPVTVNDDFPDIGANALPIAFGNFANAYTIVDRIGIRMLRDPYTNKPMVGFYSTKRVGGMLKDSEAVKFIKCSA